MLRGRASRWGSARTADRRHQHVARRAVPKPMSGELSSKRRGDRNCPYSGSTLRRDDRSAGVHRPANPDHAGREVDVVPFKRAQFTASQPWHTGRSPREPDPNPAEPRSVRKPPQATESDRASAHRRQVDVCAGSARLSHIGMRESSTAEVAPRPVTFATVSGLIRAHPILAQIRDAEMLADRLRRVSASGRVGLRGERSPG